MLIDAVAVFETAPLAVTVYPKDPDTWPDAPKIPTVHTPLLQAHGVLTVIFCKLLVEHAVARSPSASV